MNDPLDMSELAERLATQAGTSVDWAKRIIRGLADEVTESLQEGHAVKLRGFGQFHVEHERKPKLAFRPGKAAKGWQFQPSATRNSALAKSPGPPVGPPPPPINKKTLIVRLAEDSDVSVKDARLGVTMVTKEISKAMGAGREVHLRGFGTFKPVRSQGDDE